MNKYINNKYILFGVIGIAFYLYKRNQILKSNPKAKKSVEKLEEKTNFVAPETEVKEEKVVKVGDKFIKDVEKMDNSVLKRSMETNEKMLKRAKMSDEKRKMIKDMLAYMKEEYDNRTRKKQSTTNN